MDPWTVAVIGTGDPDAGAGIAYVHAQAYAGIEDCELVACADIVPENAEAFAAEWGLPAAAVYEDYEAMLRETDPDVVSVCTSPAAHAELVVGAARTGVPDAIHCEKPMATTWSDARLMVQEADRHGVQLTFNHQRRFGTAWREARELIEAGAVGEVRRVETGPPNFFDWGTHAVDLCHYLAGEPPVEWVLGAVDYRDERLHFGVHHENQGLAHWHYANGVHGLATTGRGREAVGALSRVLGTDGTIEVTPGEGATLRVRRAGETEWEERGFDEDWIDMIRRGIRDLLDSLESGAEPGLSGWRALAATEVLFGAYESARRRGRVDFPLEIEDHPLESMVEAGDLLDG